MTNPGMSKSDVGWSLMFLGIFFSSVIVFILIAIFFLIPNALDYPNTLPRRGNDGVIEFVIVSVSTTIGLFLPIFIICYISRKYVDIETYNRWVLQFENGKSRLPRLTRWLGNILMQKMKPSGF